MAFGLPPACQNMKRQAGFFFLCCGLHEQLDSIVLHFVRVEDVALYCGLQILVPQALHYSLRLCAVLCQYGPVGMPEAVAVKERVSQLLMEHPGAILERLRRQELSVFAG